MVKGILPFIFFLLTVCNLYSQPGIRQSGFPDFSFHEFEPLKKNISLNSEYYFGSNAITAKFFNYYYLNRFIDNELKNDVSHNLDDTGNRLGAGFNTSLFFTYKTKQADKATKLFFAGISNRNFSEALFTRDMFEVYFRGNHNYEGDTADFSDFHFRLYEYQKLTWGMFNATEDSAKVSYGLSGSVLIGQSLKDINVSGNLYTAENGEYLDLNVNGNMHASDSAHTSIISVNGLGVSADFYFQYTLSDLVVLNFSVSDFGFMHWNKNTSLVSVDTNYHYDGIEVNDLFNFSDSIFSNSSLSDSAQTEQFLTDRKKQSYSIVLPVRAALELTYLMKQENISLTLRDEIMSSDEFRNLLTICLGWKASTNTILSAEASYGGYGNLNAGIIASFLIAKKFSLTVGSHAVNGFIAPASSTSGGVFVSLKRYF